jgi:hypothetical protein
VLQVFFAGDGVVDVLEAFEVDEALDFVLCGEGFRSSIAMLANASAEIVGDAYVEGA